MADKDFKDLNEANNYRKNAEKQIASLQDKVDNLSSQSSSKGKVTTGAYTEPDVKLDKITSAVDLAGDLWTEVQSTFSGENLLSDIETLSNQAQSLANSMGLGSARSQELRTYIANTVPEMVKLGFTEQQALQAFEDVSTTLKVNTTLSTETMSELGAASKLTTKPFTTLIDSFKEVGVNLDKVGDNMAGVANYAKSVGVNVKAVTDGVVTNIARLNTMNFEGGIKGLTKMVSQSEMLGVNMTSVLQQADKLMNPEKAIEFSSALQRLGVQSSSLLDPLSAMDMALNDPTELQNQMVKVSQQFTRMKADGSGFEILPGAKLQMKEVAESMGMTAAEFSKMALKSADFEMKMKSIRFPSLAASEEDRSLIANMAQMKDGRAVVQITDEKTGETKEVDVESLTADQIEKLKEEQANQNKTAEEIAKEQLTVQQQIAANTAAAKGEVRMGVASSAPLQRATNAVLKTGNELVKGFTEQMSTSSVRGGVTDILGPVEQQFVNLATGGINVDKISEALTSLKNELPTKIAANLVAVGKFGIEGLKAGYTGAKYEIQKEYEPLTGKPATKENEGSTTDPLLVLLANAEEKAKNTVQTFLHKFDINYNVTGNSTNVPNDQIINAVKEGAGDIFSDQKLMSVLDKEYGSYKTSQGMNQ